MSLTPGLLDRIQDRLNPILVKEIRQALRSRVLSWGFVILLLLLLLICGVFLAAGESLDYAAGRDLFLWSLGILLGCSIVLVPAFVGVRMAMERSDGHMDLLFITTLSPRKIIWGKLQSALLLSALVFSVVLPFASFSYFLRGIDFASMAVLLTAALLLVCNAIQLGTFIACLNVGRVGKILLGLAGALGLFVAFVTFMVMAGEALRMGVGSMLVSGELWFGAVAFLIIQATVLAVLFALCVTEISPPTTNRVLSLRILVTVAWIIGGALATLGVAGGGVPEAIYVWGSCSVVVLGLAACASTSERDELGARVRRSIPRNRIARIPAFFFWTGSANGLAWAILLIATTLVLTRAIVNLAPPTFFGRNDAFDLMLGISFYSFAYALTAAYIRRRLLQTRVAQGRTWVLVLLMIFFMSTVPMVIGYMVTNSPADLMPWLFGNPFALGSKSFRHEYAAFAFWWALIAIALNAGWFVARVKAFKPIETGGDGRA